MIDPLDSSESTLRLILWRALSSYSVEDLLPLLLDGDAIVRTAAAKQLHVRPNQAVFKHVSSLCDHQSDDAREIGAFVLGQLGTPVMPFRARSIPILIGLLEGDSSADVRAAATGALGHLAADEANRNLLHAAGDRSAGVRACVAFALGRLTYVDEVGKALKRLARSRNPEVRDWSLLSLELVGRPLGSRGRGQPQPLASRVRSAKLGIRCR